MFKKLIAVLIICASVYLSFEALLPNKISNLDTPLTQFSTDRALVHLAEISKAPHYTGNKENERVRHYIISELEKLGLTTQTQEGYINSKWNNFTKPVNILARIKGESNSKALMLLTHYDSNPHSSIGASDAGSGVVTILEGLRAYLAEGNTPKNDIIVCITDAEELGLNGAELFVNKHPWAKDVGLVLNFEARGSGGPSYMLIETNGGNANLMKEFVAANPQYPVANSLAYSIYKMLPNDTDLTVFRRDGDIEGFNFAFIDDHFDYHTVKDNYQRLDRTTLEHQGTYLMPLLKHFSQANLKTVKSTEDNVYFNVPFFKTITYPFNWIMPMLIVAILLFFSIVVYGFRQKQLNTKDIGKGFVAYSFSLIFSGLLVYFGWQLILIIYPEYTEILHGFTYNGHTYIWLSVLITLSISFWVYSKLKKVNNLGNLLVAPLTFWIIICCLVALKLKGASFFVIPLYFGLLALFVLVKQYKPNLVLLAILTMPVLLIMSPFVKMFPVGLGLKILFVSAILVVLIFGLCLPVFGHLKHKTRWSFSFLILSIIGFLSAHFNSSFTEDRPKPNSLVYAIDSDTKTAYWATYDNSLDSYTKNFIDTTSNNNTPFNANTFGSKYGTGFSFTKKAPLKNIAEPTIQISKDTIIDKLRSYTICITPNRDIQRLEVFADSTMVFKKMVLNGVEITKENKEDNTVFKQRKNNRLFCYYTTDQNYLELDITVPIDQKTTLQLYEASNDLLENNLFTIPKRLSWMIPKPFVLNDAIIIKKTITID